MRRFLSLLWPRSGGRWAFTLMVPILLVDAWRFVAPESWPARGTGLLPAAIYVGMLLAGVVVAQVLVALVVSLRPESTADLPTTE